MMFFPLLCSMASERSHRIRFLGTGNGTVPTIDLGHGVSAAWIATGRLTITWKDNPGTFVGLGSTNFRDNTSQTTVKGFTVTAGAYPATASTFTLELDIWNASQAAADLATTSFLDQEFIFSELKAP